MRLLYIVKFGFLNLGRKYYATLMCPQMEDKFQRSWRWSNPNISEGGTVTGTVERENVARNVSANASSIADFRPNPTNGYVTAAITGENYVMSYGTKTYDPIVSCGAAPYTYYWERSNDGFNYVGGSTAERYSFVIYPLNGSRAVYLRLRVTAANGQTAMAYYTITIPMGGASGRIAADSTLVSKTEAIRTTSTQRQEIDATKLIQVVYPNPATDHVTAAVFMPTDNQLTLMLLGLQGQELNTVYQGQLSHGVYHFDIPTQYLATGIYFIKASTDQKSESAKIVIQK